MADLGFEQKLWITADKMRNNMEKFDRTCSSMDDCIANNEKQTEELTQIRDSLLPKLISGRIRVKT